MLHAQEEKTTTKKQKLALDQQHSVVKCIM